MPLRRVRAFFAESVVFDVGAGSDGASSSWSWTSIMVWSLRNCDANSSSMLRVWKFWDVRFCLTVSHSHVNV